MEYIFITLKKSDVEIDLKLPYHLSVSQFLTIVSEVFHEEITPATRIQVEPLGRILDPTTTLAQEGITNGSLFTWI